MPMPTIIIHVDGADLIAQLDERGWTQEAWTNLNGAICAHQAIRLCSPQPGDAYLIEQVAERQGWGTGWNDDRSTTEADVRGLLARGVDITDGGLADTFGPQWRAVVAVVRMAATLTPNESVALPFQDSGWYSTWRAASVAARHSARGSAWDAARAAAWGHVVARTAAGAVVVWDLASPEGPFTPALRDQLISPWLAAQPDLLDHIVEVEQ